ncbi:MAG: hypothetical protein GWN84_00175 [Gammaproteobacteria bacterium]|nr:hypothetical protein [Gammaproteobacteria bacterium]NIR81621.1 hypothetical protein [Gammaproteobacteria bacterium]NIR88172.1 hypothetical protein [Gammaproteobacteria bacterium]NIU02733.1 hypothetical protein [Gammaproteobacteria bacterium]NIV73332.1 hypothetical protein [Gammaproteobacteria bacterium]
MLVYRLRHANDYAIFRDRFGVPVSTLLFPSDLLQAVLAAGVALSLCSFPELSLPGRIVVLGCLAHVTARHLVYVLRPVSLTDVFRQTSGNVFLKLIGVGLFDLTTLAAVYAAWTGEGWSSLNFPAFVGTVVEVLTLQQPAESLIGLESPLRERFRTISTILYYAGVARIIWPPKNLQRTRADLMTIGARQAFRGRYGEALGWLRGIEEPDRNAIVVVSACYLGLGELDTAVAYAKRGAPPEVAATDFSFLVLFNSTRLLEVSEDLVPDMPPEREGLRSYFQEQIARRLLDRAAASGVTDSVMWLGYVTFSLFGVRPGVSRDESVNKLLGQENSPLSRMYAEFEEIEEEYSFFCAMEKELPDTEGVAERKAELEAGLRRLESTIREAAPQELTDKLLQHCLALILASYGTHGASDDDTHAEQRIREMKLLLSEMRNDIQRLLAVEMLQIFEDITRFQLNAPELGDRLQELTKEAVIALESVTPWWAELFLRAVREDQVD